MLILLIAFVSNDNFDIPTVQVTLDPVDLLIKAALKDGLPELPLLPFSVFLCLVFAWTISHP